MSRRPLQQPRRVSKAKREVVARKVAETFNKLPPDKKRKFVDDYLTTLVNANPKQLGKMFSKVFRKKGRPSDKDLELLNQLIVVFLYSVKFEYQFHYATMIYKSLKVPIPPELPGRLQQVRKMIFLGDIGVSPEVYRQMYASWEKMGQPAFDEFFTKLMDTAEAKA